MSPFVSLPTATTLSYNYKTLPSALPPSSLGIPAASSSSSDDPSAQANKPRYVVSGSGGHAAHPDDIAASCRALHEHVTKLQQDAERELSEYEDRIKQRELAEKRRVAPGWLDSEARILEPERAGKSTLMDEAPPADEARKVEEQHDEGAQLDRVFGGMSLRQ